MKILGLAALVAVIPMFAFGQNVDHHYPWQGDILIGVGSASISPSYGVSNSNQATAQFALGGEVISKPGLGLGFEMGWANWVAPYREPWVRTPSLDVTYHLPKVANRKIESFVAAGATLMYFQTHDNRGSAASNFGGGVNVWFANHMGLRCDLRVFRQGKNYTYPNLIEFRVGLAFR